MRIQTLAALVAVTAAGASIPAIAQMAAPSPSQYVMKAGASDKFEISEAQVMLGSSDQQIQKFARMMIADHNKSTVMVKDAAHKDKVTVPGQPKLEPKQQAMLTALTKAQAGPQRKALYIQQQKQSHQEALELQQAEAQGGTTPALRKAASDIVPVVQSHIDMLNKMPSTM